MLYTPYIHYDSRKKNMHKEKNVLFFNELRARVKRAILIQSASNIYVCVAHAKTYYEL